MMYQAKVGELKINSLRGGADRRAAEVLQWMSEVRLVCEALCPQMYPRRRRRCCGEPGVEQLMLSFANTTMGCARPFGWGGRVAAGWWLRWNADGTRGDRIVDVWPLCSCMCRAPHVTDVETGPLSETVRWRGPEPCLYEFFYRSSGVIEYGTFLCNTHTEVSKG
jgi:hypothetical protein